MQFSYNGIDAQGKGIRGLIRANSREQAILQIKATTDIVVITSLKETVDNAILNVVRSNLGGQVQNVQNTIAENRIKRDKKSLEKELTKAEKRREEIYNPEVVQSFAGIRRAFNGMRLNMQARKEAKATSIDTDEEIIVDDEAYQELMNMFKEREEEFGDLGESRSLGIVNDKEPPSESAVDWTLIEAAEGGADGDDQNLLNYSTVEKYNVKVSNDDIIMLTRRIQIMLASGVTMVNALGLIAEDEEDDMKVMLDKIVDDIHMGSTFSEAIARFPKQFDTNYVALVTIGETAGSLEDTLLDIVDVMVRESDIKKQLKSAAIYPSIIGMVLGVVLVLGSIFFIPMFEEIFEDNGSSLPMLTKVVFAISDAVPFIVGGIFLFIVIYTFAKRNSLYIQRRHAQFVSMMSYKIPVIKDVNNIYQMHSFASTVALMQKNGVQLNNSLILAQKATKNVYIKSEIIRASLMMAEGFALSAALEEQEHFDSILINIVKVGEETGEMDVVLAQIADFYSGELTRKIEDLMSMVQPASMILIGLIAAPVIIAIYMPILSMSSGGGM